MCIFVRKLSTWTIYYNVVFNEETGFPSEQEVIKVENLHVQLQLCSVPVPLPSWFVDGRNTKLTRFSMLENFLSYLRNCMNNQKLLHEICTLQYDKAQGRPPYSPAIIRLALLLRYTSGPAYKLLLQHFPLPSISLLKAQTR